jgi:hypothetical protein
MCALVLGIGCRTVGLHRDKFVLRPDCNRSVILRQAPAHQLEAIGVQACTSADGQRSNG